MDIVVSKKQVLKEVFNLFDVQIKLVYKVIILFLVVYSKNEPFKDQVDIWNWTDLP